MMPPFGPEADPQLKYTVDVLLVALSLLTAIASVVWGLQDRYSDAVSLMRELARECRAAGAESRTAALEQLQVLVRRTRLLRGSVLAFYATTLLQVLAAAWAGLALLKLPLPLWPLILLFEVSLVVLFAGIALALIDTALVYRSAEEEAREAGLC